MKAILGLLFSNLIFTNAQASNFTFEPYVGLAKTQVRQNATKFYDVADGFYLGAKLEYKLNEKTTLGADYHRGGPYKFGPLLGNSEWTHSMLGGGIGLHYSVAHYWLGYYFSNTYQDNSSGTKFTGTGIKVGIGFSVSSKLKCNLELLYSSINKMEDGPYSADFDGYAISSAHVSVSIPIR